MRHLPEICISVCGAIGLVAVVLLPWLLRSARRGRDYVTVQGVPDGNGEWL
mgnify:FL=1